MTGTSVQFIRFDPHNDDTSVNQKYAFSRIVWSTTPQFITDAANAELASWSFPSEIPVLTIDGNVAPFITDYKIGDRVQVKIRNYATLTHISAYYRIEKLELIIDEEDNETIKMMVSA